MNLGFIETIVWPDMDSDASVQTRFPVSAFQQWMRPSLAPKTHRDDGVDIRSLGNYRKRQTEHLDWRTLQSAHFSCSRSPRDEEEKRMPWRWENGHVQSVCWRTDSVCFSCPVNASIRRIMFPLVVSMIVFPSALNFKLVHSQSFSLGSWNVEKGPCEREKNRACLPVTYIGICNYLIEWSQVVQLDHLRGDTSTKDQTLITKDRHCLYWQRKEMHLPRDRN